MDRAGDDTDRTHRNREQLDEGQQAHDYAEAALNPEPGLGDSTRAPRSAADTSDADLPDLVETMRAMVNSGVIDTSAFAGEPQHDDEEDILGATEDEGEEELDGLSEVVGLGDDRRDPGILPDSGESPLADIASDEGEEDELGEGDLDDEDLVALDELEDELDDDLWEDEEANER